MTGLCEGGNEPPGFFECQCATRRSIRVREPPACLSRLRHLPAGLKLRSGAGSIPLGLIIWLGFSEVFPNRKVNARKNDAETDQEEEKKLFGSLTEKKLPTEGCTGRNGEREKSSRQKKISDHRRH
ncbi:hypothetical protein ANN_19941 [Periplaneta americana]|uniref:Uncharacterized protein n=1 Tax=Periplaneta americana TaxID=6978 RepID=A0ABQ8SBU9_PERAM|nr:hypothetical protein ANN_19941 [Periplaneta americana]